MVQIVSRAPKGCHVVRFTTRAMHILHIALIAIPIMAPMGLAVTSLVLPSTLAFCSSFSAEQLLVVRRLHEAAAASIY